MATSAMTGPGSTIVASTPTLASTKQPALKNQ